MKGQKLTPHPKATVPAPTAPAVCSPRAISYVQAVILTHVLERMKGP